MKLYFHVGRWELPGQQSKGAERVDIPNNPAALCAWLNERRVPIVMPLHSPPAAESRPAAPVPAAPSCATAADLEDFVLNRATIAEVERIFAALGARFAEARGN